MKLSARLAIIVLTAVIGLLVIAGFALSALNSSIIEEREASIHLVLRLAAKEIAYYQGLEKVGTLTREQAQGQARLALSQLRDGDDFIFVRRSDGLILVHPDARKVGKTDTGGSLPDGRTVFQGYLDAVSQAGFGYVKLSTKRPGGVDEVPKINGVMRIDDWGWIVGTGVYLSDLKSLFWLHALQFGGIGLSVLLIVVLCAVGLARQIYRKLGGEPDYAADVSIAIAKGDLSRRIEIHGNQESLLGAIVDMQSNLRQMVATIQSGASSLHATARGIAGQMDQISTASQQSSEATSSTAAAIEELTVSVNQISCNALETENHSARSHQLAQQGGSLVQDAAAEIQQVATQISEASARIASLDGRVGEIDGIANVIREIADQTNLLALNAAIEAARAGEQGRGFAVVADEVRKLAERTSQATGQIAVMIRAIQDDTHAVVDSMGAIAPQVGRSVEKTDRASEVLHQIREGSAMTLDKIRDVAHSTSEQSKANSSVAGNIERIANRVEASAAAVRAAHVNALELERLSRELDCVVSRFKVA